jgi:hypothetical protein
MCSIDFRRKKKSVLQSEESTIRYSLPHCCQFCSLLIWEKQKTGARDCQLIITLICVRDYSTVLFIIWSSVRIITYHYHYRQNKRMYSGESFIAYFFVYLFASRMIDQLEKNRRCSKLNGMLRQCISIPMQFFDRTSDDCRSFLFRSLSRFSSHIMRMDRTYNPCTTIVIERNNSYWVRRRWRFKLVLWITVATVGYFLNKYI